MTDAKGRLGFTPSSQRVDRWLVNEITEAYVRFNKVMAKLTVYSTRGTAVKIFRRPNTEVHFIEVTFI